MSEAVARYKLEHGMEVLQAGREQVVLDRAEACVPEENRRDVRALYREILHLSKAAQRRLLPSAPESAGAEWIQDPLVGYFGVEGAFSEQAAMQFFGPQARRVCFPSLEEVACAVREKRADYGVVPIENSSTGTISECYDCISRERLFIVGEQNVRIRQHLLALPGAKLSDIRRVYSHAQGIAQCGEFLHAHPDWQLIPYKNTAISANKVFQDGDPSQAAIASSRAAERYGLNILAADIHEDKKNHTRFVIVSREMVDDPRAEKASVVFNTRNQPGALARVLNRFSEYDLNMTRLESRPIPQRPWEYVFYADFEGELQLGKLRRTLREIEPDTQALRLLGLYRKGRGGVSMEFYGLIGEKLGHSLSPQIHQMIFP